METVRDISKLTEWLKSQHFIPASGSRLGVIAARTKLAEGELFEIVHGIKAMDDKTAIALRVIANDF